MQKMNGINTVWLLLTISNICHGIVIVQSYEEDAESSASSNAKVVAINISREIIQKEVNDSVESIQTKIHSLEGSLHSIKEDVLEKQSTSGLKLRRISKTLEKKEGLICEMLDYQVALQEDVARLRRRVNEIEVLALKKSRSKKVRKTRSKKPLMKTNVVGDKLKKDAENMINSSNFIESDFQGTFQYSGNDVASGIPQWVRKLKQNRAQRKLGLEFCQNRNVTSVKGVPQWVTELKFRKLRELCIRKEEENSCEYNVLTSYTIKQDGYGSDVLDDIKSETGKPTSKKSTKRKIDEAFLAMMMRAKRLSWIDIERLGENARFFAYQVSEIGKLCAGAATSLEWEKVEKCKEQIGMNFAVSLIVTLLATIVLVCTFLLTALTIHHAGHKVKVIPGHLSSAAAAIKTRMYSKENSNGVKVSKTPRRSLRDFLHSTPPRYVCVISANQTVQDAAQHLITRVYENDEALGNKVTLMYVDILDFEENYHPATKYILVTELDKSPRSAGASDVTNRDSQGDLLTALDGDLANNDSNDSQSDVFTESHAHANTSSLFEDEEGKPSSAYRVMDQLAKKSEDLFLICVNDQNSKQLPKGRLYNRTLAAENDNYLLRVLCRHDKFISINKEFTASQARRINEWFHIKS